MSETRVALLTGSGKSALATVGLFGPDAWRLARGLFTPRNGKPLPETPEPGRFWLGAAGADIADEAILAARATGLIEIHSHGGREVPRYLLGLLVERGAVECDATTLIRSVVADADPIETEALLALPSAPTLRTAGILLAQARGALRNELHTANEAIRAGDRERGRAILVELLNRARVGRHLVTPFRVVVAGPPNVGKSSLVNALAGYERSIVSATPGTTRDVVTTALAFDGWPVELADTAGLREGGETLENLGMDQARAALEQADLCLWLIDASGPCILPPLESTRLQLVINKVDLPIAADFVAVPNALRVSATTGEGIRELAERIGHWLVPNPPPEGAGVPFSEATEGLIRTALERLEAGGDPEGLALPGA